MAGILAFSMKPAHLIALFFTLAMTQYRNNCNVHIILCRTSRFFFPCLNIKFHKQSRFPGKCYALKVENRIGQIPCVIRVIDFKAFLEHNEVQSVAFYIALYYYYYYYSTRFFLNCIFRTMKLS